jgi:hypothetical protein
VVDAPDGSVPVSPIDAAALVERRAVAVLLVPTPGHAQIKLATAAGYAAILPCDGATRALYRRIGALMQKIRRPDKAVQAVAPAPLALTAVAE